MAWRISSLSTIPPRASSGERSAIAIATVFKDEADYLAEWIAFYQLIGVDFFIFYNDGSTDASLEVIERILKRNAYVVVPWSGRYHTARFDIEIHTQSLAFAHAIQNFGARFRWMAFIDVDEFIIPQKTDSLGDALAPFGDAINISLPWLMFGTNGHQDKPDGLVMENYTMRAVGQFRNWPIAYKCIVDPTQVTAVHVHYFKTKRDGWITVNDIGQMRHFKKRKGEFFSHENIQLNHYFSRSKAEFDAKAKRGALGGRKNKDSYRRRLEEIEVNQIQDETALRFVDAVNEKLKRI